MLPLGQRDNEKDFHHSKKKIMDFKFRSLHTGDHFVTTGVRHKNSLFIRLKMMMLSTEKGFKLFSREVQRIDYGRLNQLILAFVDYNTVQYFCVKYF